MSSADLELVGIVSDVHENNVHDNTVSDSINSFFIIFKFKMRQGQTYPDVIRKKINSADTKFEVPFGIHFGKFGGAVSEIIIILPG